MIHVCHPTGNPNVRAVLTALEQAGRLEAFYTTLFFQEPFPSWLPQSLRQELGRRTFPIPRPKIQGRPLREAVRLLAQQRQWQALIRHEEGWASVDQVYRDLDEAVAQKLRQQRPEGVYCYEDGAWATFQAAQALGIRCYYDLPIGFWRAAQRIQLEEAQLNPAWAATLIATCDSAAKLQRKDEELALADLVLVASQFTQTTLREAPFLKAPVVVIPYGAPPLGPPRAQVTSGKLRVLFVGGLSQRKGLSYLLNAVESLGSRVELTLIGRTVAPCPPLEAALNRHRWLPSLPNQAVLGEMQRHDVLVFPSLFEGFGLVIIEALAQGLPVITTNHTAGPDLLTEGKDGFIVPIRNAEAIAEKLRWLDQNREALFQMSQQAQQTAQRFSWQAYGEKLCNVLL